MDLPYITLTAESYSDMGEHTAIDLNPAEVADALSRLLPIHCETWAEMLVANAQPHVIAALRKAIK